MCAFFCKEVSADSHLIALWYILLQHRVVLYTFWHKIISSSYHFISIFEGNVHDNVFLDLFYIYIQVCAFFCKEISADSHLVSFRYILFQNRIIINAFRQEIIAACDHFISIFKLDIHDHLCFDFFYANFQFAILFCIEVTAYSHLIAFRHILLQYGVVLYAFRYEIVASGYHFVSVFKLNIHDHIFFSLVQINFQLAAVFCHEITADGHYITFRYILLQHRVVLYAFRYKIIASGYCNITIFEGNVHDNCLFFFFNVYNHMCAVFCHEITADGHHITFRYILL